MASLRTIDKSPIYMFSLDDILDPGADTVEQEIALDVHDNGNGVSFFFFLSICAYSLNVAD